LTALDESETVIAESEISSDGIYETLAIPPNTAFLLIDTGDKKQGRGQPLLSNFHQGCP
jgi:hypothetical protein